MWMVAHTYEWLRTKSGFDTEEKDNLKMAFYLHQSIDAFG